MGLRRALVAALDALPGRCAVLRAKALPNFPGDVRFAGPGTPPTIERLVRKSRRVGRKTERAALLGYAAARLESLRAAKVIA
jgi:hypothetical protein